MSKVNVSITFDENGNQIIHNSYPVTHHDPRYPYGIVNAQYHNVQQPVINNSQQYLPQPNRNLEVTYSEIGHQHNPNKEVYLDARKTVLGIPVSWICAGLFLSILGIFLTNSR